MSVPREGKWRAKPLKPRKTFFDVAWMFSTPIYALGYLCHRLGWLAEAIGMWLSVASLAGLLACMTLMPLRELLLRRRTLRDRRFSDLPGSREEFAVEIVVRRRGKALGADRGVVWFEEGLLAFSGERTSFLLSRDDLVLPGKAALSWIDVPFLPLRLNRMGAKAEVVVRPMWGSGRGYRRTLMMFLRSDAVAASERQWPPLERFHPSSRAGT